MPLEFELRSQLTADRTNITKKVGRAERRVPQVELCRLSEYARRQRLRIEHDPSARARDK
jgi:hypothetical protein